MAGLKLESDSLSKKEQRFQSFDVECKLPVDLLSNVLNHFHQPSRSDYIHNLQIILSININVYECPDICHYIKST